MNIREIYRHNSSFPALDLDIILSYTLEKPKEFLFAHPEYHLSFWQTIRFNHFLRLYKRGLPIAYITHHKEFFGLDFYVNKHTLIPRPDTEIMVEKVLEEVEGRRSKVESLVLVDVGTGSGCIPISIMKTFPPQADQPRAEKYESIKTYAIDISTKALKIARKNAEQHKVKIEFLSGNLLEPFLRLHNNITMKQHNNEVIILTANLPYLTHEQFKNEPSIQHEPYLALVAEEQGLQLYKELLQQIKKLLVTHNLQLVTFFEIDPSQTALIISEIKKSLPAAQVDVIPDLAGRDRVIKFSIVN